MFLMKPNQTASGGAAAGGIPEWKPNETVAAGVIIRYGNGLYYCKASHAASSNFVDDNDKWEALGGKQSIDGWRKNTEYYVGDMAIKDNGLYKCKSRHTSGAAFDKSKWESVGTTRQEAVKLALVCDTGRG